MGRARGKEAAATRTQLDIAKAVIANHLLLDNRKLHFAKLELEHDRTVREQQIE